MADERRAQTTFTQRADGVPPQVPTLPATASCHLRHLIIITLSPSTPAIRPALNISFGHVHTSQLSVHWTYCECTQMDDALLANGRLA